MKFKNARLLKAAFLLILAAALLGFSSCASVNGAGSDNSDNNALLPYGPPPLVESDAYDIEELYISHGEDQIYGVLFLPKDREGERLPLVIISHGYNDDSWRSLKYAAPLAEAGFATFCFDFCGGRLRSQSTGSALDMTLFTEQADLEAVMAEMKELPFVDGENIFLVGASQGSVISALVAAARPEEVRGMALIYPAFMLPDMARSQFASAGDIPESSEFLKMTIGKAYYETMLDFDIYAAIEPYKGNVLIIHGDADDLVPLSYSERALEVYASAELKVIPDAGHSFSAPQARQAMDWILEFLQRETGRL